MELTNENVKLMFGIVLFAFIILFRFLMSRNISYEKQE